MFQYIQTGIPVLSDAERLMKGDLHAIHGQLDFLQDSLSQVQLISSVSSAMTSSLLPNNSANPTPTFILS